MGHKYAILLGLVLLAVSMPLYLAVTNVWLLVLPALAAGLSHAFLFPSVMASGGLAFPKQNRGLATTLMLGCFDCGVLVGAPLVGSILNLSAQWNLPKYPTMFFSVSVLLLATALIYFVVSSTSGDRSAADDGQAFAGNGRR
jgi:MFS family permease